MQFRNFHQLLFLSCCRCTVRVWKMSVRGGRGVMYWWQLPPWWRRAGFRGSWIRRNRGVSMRVPIVPLGNRLKNIAVIPMTTWWVYRQSIIKQTGNRCESLWPFVLYWKCKRLLCENNGFSIFEGWIFISKNIKTGNTWVKRIYCLRLCRYFFINKGYD